MVKKHNRGLTGRAKATGPGRGGPGAGRAGFTPIQGSSTTLTIPFFEQVQPNLGFFYIPFAVFVIVGCANAVNLTDGLDSLAIGPVTIAAAFYMIFCYLAGNIKIAQYLQIPYVRGVGELSIFWAPWPGPGWASSGLTPIRPQVFMGDVGALALGRRAGRRGHMATKQRVRAGRHGRTIRRGGRVRDLQVGYFKVSTGKRVFRMAPIHHHFENSRAGRSPKVIVRFWIISIILGLVALSALKLR